MKKIRNKKGLTFVELLIASALIVFAIGGAINLMTKVYKGIVFSKLKSKSMAMCNEKIEELKNYGFASLPLTPDSILPPPLSKLYSDINPFYPESITISSGVVFTIYPVVQYAKEDDNGNIVPMRMSEGLPTNLKQIHVYVTYTYNNFEYTTDMVSLVNNSFVPMTGAKITGNITLSGGGTPSSATIKIISHPEYTVNMQSNGTYEITNVYPGYYYLYCEGPGFYTTYYSGNPLYVSNTAKTYNVDFVVQEINPAYIEGIAYKGTPSSSTPTFTPTPLSSPTPGATVVKTIILHATGQMSNPPGGTQDFTNPTNITADDSNYAYTHSRNSDLYTFFDTYSEANTEITSVLLRIDNYTDGADPSYDYYDQYYYDNGSWYAVGSWTMISSWNIKTFDITGRHSPWTWSDINNFGLRLVAQSSKTDRWGNPQTNFDTAYLDHIYLEITYNAQGSAPTPTFTPTSAGTPTPTPALETLEGVTVYVNDGLSSTTTTNSSGYYIVSNIDPVAGPGGCLTLTASKYDNINSLFYYYETLVCGISPGVTKTVDLYMTTVSAQAFGEGYVLDANDRQSPIYGAEVTLSDPIALSPTTNVSGYYLITQCAMGSYRLNVSCAGYIPENSTSVDRIVSVTYGKNTFPTLYMYPVGGVSGNITLYPSGAPVSDINVWIKNSAGILLGIAKSDETGYYEALSIPAGTNYTVELQLSGGSNVEPYYPADGKLTGVNVIKGSTATNKNFQVKYSYSTINVNVIFNGKTINEAVLLIAYPSSTSYHAHDYSLDNTSEPFTQSLRYRKQQPFYSTLAKGEGSLHIRVPVNDTYDIYAYYTSVTYTGNTKTINKYYAVETNIAPDSTVTISGPWNAY